jgi:putative PEP-CTERM system histidine kinase
LVDARLVTEYSRRFAFVVHDIKNVVSQLTMTVTNARAHGDDPEFQKDLLVTLENSVSRMNELLSKLRASNTSAREQEPLDSRRIISSVINEVGRRRVTVLADQGDTPVRVAIKPSSLRSALTHLITNAVEASREDQPVTVRSRVTGGRLVVEVEDRGPGMDADFVREQLFRPFRSTKASGHGIGAYQTREIIREAGGDLQVISAPGKGTVMRILLPCLAEERADSRPFVGAS